MAKTGSTGSLGGGGGKGTSARQSVPGSLNRLANAPQPGEPTIGTGIYDVMTGDQLIVRYQDSDGNQTTASVTITQRGRNQEGETGISVRGDPDALSKIFNVPKTMARQLTDSGKSFHLTAAEYKKAMRISRAEGEFVIRRHKGFEWRLDPSVTPTDTAAQQGRQLGMGFGSGKRTPKTRATFTPTGTRVARPRGRPRNPR